MIQSPAKLSPHFSYVEAVRSQLAARHGIDNTPSPQTLEVMRRTAGKMEVVRFVLQSPLVVSSWYRCVELNALLGSRPTSQHCKGEAVDFHCDEYGTPLQVCRALIEQQHAVMYDQLILEHDWVHISFAIIPPCEPRLQVLSLLHNGGYANGLTDSFGKAL